MDQIRIRGLRIYAGHGVYEEEKKLGQAFYVDAVLDTDLRAAGEKDELGLSTDYGAVCGKIAEVMTGQSFSLIEAAAEKTAREILLSFPTVEGVELVLHKPQAPIPMSFEDVSVRIHRSWHTAYVALGSNLGDREALLRFLGGILKKDPVKTILVDMTPLGLVEITRKKVRKPLYEQQA